MCLGALVVLTFFLSSKYVPVDVVVNQRRSYKIYLFLARQLCSTASFFCMFKCWSL